MAFVYSNLGATSDCRIHFQRRHRFLFFVFNQLLFNTKLTVNQRTISNYLKKVKNDEEANKSRRKLTIQTLFDINCIVLNEFIDFGLRPDCSQ